MNTSGEVADLVVKECIQVTESALKLSLLGSKHLAAMLFTATRGNRKGKAKVRSMLRDGRELQVLSIPVDKVATFNLYAKKYGVTFAKVPVNCSYCDLLIRAEDVGKVNRVIERLNEPQQKKGVFSNLVKEDSSLHGEMAEKAIEHLSNLGQENLAALLDTMAKDQKLPPQMEQLINECMNGKSLSILQVYKKDWRFFQAAAERDDVICSAIYNPSFPEQVCLVAKDEDLQQLERIALKNNINIERKDDKKKVKTRDQSESKLMGRENGYKTSLEKTSTIRQAISENEAKNKTTEGDLTMRVLQDGLKAFKGKEGRERE